MKTNLLDGMVTFVNVVESGSFTMAALHTGRSTSYISKEVSKLEQRLGIRLLHRTTRTLRLTPEGELYYQTSKQIVESAESIESGFEGKQIEPQGCLRVSCPVGFGITQLSPLLAKFMTTYPKVTIDVELNDQMVDLIADGIDVAIRAVHKPKDSSLISKKFGTSHTVTVASPTYLNVFGKPNAIGQLSEHRVITYKNHKSPNLWVYKDLNNEEQRVEVTSIFTANNLDIGMRLCEEGIGVARLPCALVQDKLTSGKLIELFDDLPKDNIDLCLVYPSRKQVSSKVRAFITFMIENLE